MLRGIKDVNDKLEANPVGDEVEELMVMSMDVAALYPSLQVEEVVRIVGEMLMATELEIEDVDYRLQRSMKIFEGVGRRE